MATDDPTSLESILSALEKSNKLKHWHNPPQEYGPDNPEFSDYNRNGLTDPGDLSLISFTEEFAFSACSSDKDEDEEVTDSAQEETNDEEQSFLDDLPSNVVISHNWMDPAEESKEKEKVPSLQIAEQARHQTSLLMRMQDMKLEDDCRKSCEEKTVSHYQNYMFTLKDLKRQHRLKVEKYCKERNEKLAQEEVKLRRQEEDIQQTLQQQQQEYSHYIQQKTQEISKLVEDAEKREAEHRNLIQGLVNELHTLKSSYLEHYEQVKQLLKDLNGDETLDASVVTMCHEAIKPVDNVLESVTKEVLSKNELVETKRNLQININYLQDFIPALQQKKEERALQEAEHASQQATYEESQARLRAEQEKQQEIAQQQELSHVNQINPSNPAETLNENRQASVLSVACKRFEDLKKKMEDHINIQTNIDNEKKKEVGRITTIINQLDNTNHNINREKLQKLLAYLGGRSIQHNNKKYCTNNDPVITAYAKFRLIKDLLKIALEKQTREGAGFAAYAWLTASLISVHPDLWEIYLYHMYTTCPYLVPLCIYPKEGQSEDDYDKERGKKPKEKFDMYLSRMGSAALLFGLVLEKMSKKNGMPEEAPVVGWKLIAGLLTLDPSPGISAEVLRGVLMSIGVELQKTYGKQFAKLMNFAMSSYWTQVVEVSKISEQGSSSNHQLQTLFEDYHKNGKLSAYEFIDKFN